MKKNLIIFLICFNFIYAKAVRIMPFGDSITYDNTYADLKNPRSSSQRSGYRKYLWYRLQAINYDANFVGSRVAGDGISPKFDSDNDGYAGWTSYRLSEETYTLMQKSKPDIVLLHIGSNDWRESPKGVQNILDEIDTYEEVSGTSVIVILALIINRKKNVTWIKAFNANIKNMAKKRIANGDKIIIIDMEHDARINYPDDFQDSAHPNNRGYSKMANLWYNAIIHISLVPKNTKSAPQRFYNFILDRDSDINGFNMWSHYLETSSLASMAIKFFTGDEFKNRDLNNGEFINILYSSLLRRDADIEGFYYWVNELETYSITRNEIIGVFLNSKAFSNISALEGLKSITNSDKKFLKIFR
ncbi:MAG: DUF4214 domain-containing protein [Sulfurovum sp.]|nr:DUF4214 domain-containing protein [Sulfurovaceae bacterium]